MSGARVETVDVAVPVERPAAGVWTLPRNRSVWIGASLLTVVVAIALLAPVLGTVDPAAIDPVARNRRPGTEWTVTHADGRTTTRTLWMGTDTLGRDVYSRVIYGARTSLFVAFSAVILGTTVGSLWGVACGYLGGRFDLYSQRVMEILQSFPDLILAMAISMAIGTGLPAVIVAIAITRIPFGGRVIRSVALSVREMQYVEAGRASGASALITLRSLISAGEDTASAPLLPHPAPPSTMRAGAPRSLVPAFVDDAAARRGGGNGEFRRVIGRKNFPTFHGHAARSAKNCQQEGKNNWLCQHRKSRRCATIQQRGGRCNKLSRENPVHFCHGTAD